MSEHQLPQNQQIGIRRHIPELDGLRGIAIVVVMIHHFVLWHHQDAACRADRIYAMLAESGWIGVDLFFVLSGYLITGILFDAREDSRYFRNFYARRVLRIFPLYYFVLALLLQVLPRLYPNAGTPADHQWSYWAYLSNFTLTLKHSNAAETLLVTWSLAIEEQFYIFWPAIIFLCNRRQAIIAATSLLVLAIVSRILVAVLHIDATVDYFWTPCHLDGLAVGAMIALLHRTPLGLQRMITWAGALGSAGVTGVFAVAIVASFRHLSMREDPLGQIPLYSFVAMFSASLLIQGLRGRGLVASVLRLRLLRFFGKYSYGLYLYHAIVMQQVLMFGHYHIGTVMHSQLPSQGLFLVINAVITISVALLSWQVIEKPFLKLKRLFPESSAMPGRVSSG